MKKLSRVLLVMCFLFLQSCNDDEVTEIVDSENTQNTEIVENSEEDEISVSKVWRKLTYHYFENNPDISIPGDENFSEEVNSSKIVEKTGTREFLEKLYMITRRTIVNYSRITSLAGNEGISYVYERDSLDYTIALRIDTLSLPNSYQSAINPTGSSSFKFNNKYYNFIEHLSLSDEDVYEVINIELREKILDLPVNVVGEKLLDDSRPGFDRYWVNNNRKIEIEVSAGKFLCDDYSIIPRNKDGSLYSDGESSFYYYGNILVLTKESYSSSLKYRHKQELVVIEYE